MDLNKTLNKFQQTLVRGGLIKEAGLEQSRRARALLKLSASPLESVASKFGMDLDKMLLRPFIEQQILAANSLPPMDFDPDCAVTLGHHLELKVPILVAKKKIDGKSFGDRLGWLGQILIPVLDHGPVSAS